VCETSRVDHGVNVCEHVRHVARRCEIAHHSAARLRRTMSEREYRLTRELLDAHALRIDSYVSQIRQIEDRLQQEAVRMLPAKGGRRSCSAVLVAGDVASVTPGETVVA